MKNSKKKWLNPNRQRLHTEEKDLDPNDPKPSPRTTGNGQRAADMHHNPGVRR